MATSVPLQLSSFADAFPNSRKVHVPGPAGVAVPMREIALSDSPDLRVLAEELAEDLSLHHSEPFSLNWSVLRCQSP